MSSSLELLSRCLPYIAAALVPLGRQDLAITDHRSSGRSHRRHLRKVSREFVRSNVIVIGIFRGFQALLIGVAIRFKTTIFVVAYYVFVVGLPQLVARESLFWVTMLAKSPL